MSGRGEDNAGRPPAGRPNRLIGEKSPYLLQHAYNPVDWHPWGEAAFEAAVREDKPVFLSIGYSTCHWCHVMERESFEDAEVAALLNEGFIPVKVDREERPDVDSVYMTVAQMITGHGGWPLTVVMTPSKDPFFAGTYFPRESTQGRIGMLDLLPRLSALWRERRSEALNSAGQISTALWQSLHGPAPDPAGELGEASLHEAYRQLSRVYDPLQGGFGRAPKFPTPHNLRFLLRYWRRTGEDGALQMVERTLQAMRQGGVCDQVGFGFHRYSTDARWLLPHFEKMLYDQALLVQAYVDAHQATGRAEYAETAHEIIAYVLRDLRHDRGAFLSAEDADSEGREGKYYLWTVEELGGVLGADASRLVRAVFNCDRRGNFAEEASGERTGENVLYMGRSWRDAAESLGLAETELRARWSSARETLLEAREKRVRPHLDDKVLADWNGLMIGAIARAGAALGRPDYVRAAAEAYDFVQAEMVGPDGTLLHRYREGEAAIPAFADDYAFLTWGLLELYEAALDPAYLDGALQLNDRLIECFWDEERGGLFQTSSAATDLPVRNREIYDGAIPSANSVAMLNMLRLARLTADPALEAKARAIETAFAEPVRKVPSAYTQLLMAVDFRLGPSREVVIAGPPGSADTEELLQVVRSGFRPQAVLLFRPVAEGAEDGHDELSRIAPYTAAMVPIEGRATAYVCREFACERPVTDPGQLRALLAGEEDGT
ncbi:MAG: thioredoxin domain-containing protein [Gemmatimonadota bacterium]|nr:MAG: thioredoxin domain-containing protein [Gemmatimonadota bacterium]